MNNFTLPHQTITFMPLGKEKEHSASLELSKVLQLSKVQIFSPNYQQKKIKIVLLVFH